MNTPISTQTHVAGAGVAQLSVPIWAWLLKIVLSVSLIFAVLSLSFCLAGWSWLADGFTSGTSAIIATIVTGALALVWLVWRSSLVNGALGVRRVVCGLPDAQSKDKRLVYGGKLPLISFTLVLGAIVGLTLLSLRNIQHAMQTCPLPQRFERVTRNVAPPAVEEKLLPIYFWDYATWVDPNWLSQVNLVLPYEKGPPQKLLPKIYFEDAKTHTIALELHGKRPRSYTREELKPIFSGEFPHPREWPLIWRIEREAGLLSGLEQGIPKDFTLQWTEFRQGELTTDAIGVPWPSFVESSPKTLNGRIFFWGPDGSVFQTRCEFPCVMARMLELVQFPGDPKGSLAERKTWTGAKLKEILSETQATNPKLRENLLTLYLVSLLTLDPRDPEAFFHLGKLARNRETVISAIRYGKDLGLEPAKIAELEATATRFTY